MGVANYETVSKIGTQKMIEEALYSECIVSNPIEHYSMEEIKELAELAKKNDLIFSIKEERSNLYQGILLCLVKRIRVQEVIYFIKHL